MGKNSVSKIRPFRHLLAVEKPKHKNYVKSNDPNDPTPYIPVAFPGTSAAKAFPVMKQKTAARAEAIGKMLEIIPEPEEVKNEEPELQPESEPEPESE